nr:hypothetical protein [uncultured Desulfobulbus sp.]
MRPLTLMIIATTVLVTLISACSHTPMEKNTSMESSMESMGHENTMHGAMDKGHKMMMHGDSESM